ncbi:MAG: tRNA lysidine(34) synthetase TilS [Paludibacteraceae bacterium]
MRHKISRFIAEELKLTPHTKLILGISGGIDSVVMLQILNKLDYKCVIAHCNFHLRGEESSRDEEVVHRLADKLQLPFEKIDFDTKAYARKHKLSIEMAARDLRYNWFENLRQKYNSPYIAVAHHKDDSIETLLMNLIRGTGLRGLKGIEPINGKIIRPLLCCTRQEIESYATKNHLNFVTDSTNADTDFVRNKIRLQIIPALAEINPSIKQTLSETTERLQGTWKIFEQTIQEIKQEITIIKDNKLHINIKKLQQQADIRTVLFEILQPYSFHPDVVNQVTDNLTSNSGLKFYSADYILIKDRDYLILIKNTELENEANEVLIEKDQARLDTPIALTFAIKKKDTDFIVSKSKYKIHLNYDKLKFPLVVRKWRPGDIFKPFGMQNFKKVSNFLIDEKVDLITKQHTLVIASNEDIVWIIGMRIDNRFKISEKTTRIFEINVNL